MTHHKNMLRGIAKYVAGLVTADLLVAIWLIVSNSIPFVFLGITYSTPMILGWIDFDIILIAILVYYGWHAEIHTPSLSQKNLFILVGVIIGIVALAHLFRLIFGVSVVVAGWSVPFWFSWIGVLAAFFISYSSFRFAMHARK